MFTNILSCDTYCFFFQYKAILNHAFLLISHIAKSVSIVINDKQSFNLLILRSFLNFPLIPGIYSEEIVRGIGGSFKMLKICNYLT